MPKRKLVTHGGVKKKELMLNDSPTSPFGASHVRTMPKEGVSVYTISQLMRLAKRKRREEYELATYSGGNVMRSQREETMSCQQEEEGRKERNVK